MTVVIFLVVIAILIFVHELGHFLFARMCGVRVDEFALGFGPRILSTKKGETTYALNLFPLGGYVKIFGENPDDVSTSGPDSKRSLVNKPKWQQALVLFAGVLFNFILAWVLVSLAFTFGAPTSASSYPDYASRIVNSRITVTYVEPGSPASSAKILAGDVISSINSKPIVHLEEIQGLINATAGKEFGLGFIRGGETLSTKIVAKTGIVPDKYAIGIAMDDVGTLKLPFYLAVIEGARFTLHMMKSITVGIYDLVRGIFTGTSSLSGVAGPVGIAGLVGDASRLGFVYLVTFTALISINLGVLNLVPFPALDGGRILFVAIEAVIGRRIKPVIANTLNAVGFSLLMLLIVFITYKDIIRLIHP